ncbi:MAG: DNA-3-methyladenine glycosylase family protein [Deltaproteobacteria bacterium]
MLYSFIIENIRNFSLKHTFECGQCFRWKPNNDGSYTGVVGEGVFNVKMHNEAELIVETNLLDSKEFFEQYIDNNTDYLAIENLLSGNDKIMKEAVGYGSGMRILKQEHWETLASFIISANNNIPRIMKTVENIAGVYGRKVEFKGEGYYLFPGPEELADAGEEDLKSCGLGFRGKYIRSAAQMLASGEINLKELEAWDSASARNELIRIPGVGPKVADCVLLYSYAKTDVFPIDVWIKRIVEMLYFSKEKKLNEIQEFARNKYGKLAGFAQQYLFYYARENIKLRIGK